MADLLLDLDDRLIESYRRAAQRNGGSLEEEFRAALIAQRPRKIETDPPKSPS